jgi:hypothetical protein
MAAALVIRPDPALAQSSPTITTVEQILEFLVLNQGVQTNDFDKDAEAADATRATLTRALLGSVATTPVGSPSAAGASRRW